MTERVESLKPWASVVAFLDKPSAASSSAVVRILTAASQTNFASCDVGSSTQVGAEASAAEIGSTLVRLVKALDVVLGRPPFASPVPPVVRWHMDVLTCALTLALPSANYHRRQKMQVPTVEATPSTASAKTQPAPTPLASCSQQERDVLAAMSVGTAFSIDLPVMASALSISSTPSPDPDALGLFCVILMLSRDAVKHNINELAKTVRTLPVLRGSKTAVLLHSAFGILNDAAVEAFLNATPLQSPVITALCSSNLSPIAKQRLWSRVMLASMPAVITPTAAAPTPAGKGAAKPAKPAPAPPPLQFPDAFVQIVGNDAECAEAVVSLFGPDAILALCRRSDAAAASVKAPAKSIPTAALSFQHWAPALSGRSVPLFVDMLRVAAAEKQPNNGSAQSFNGICPGTGSAATRCASVLGITVDSKARWWPTSRWHDLLHSLLERLHSEVATYTPLSDAAPSKNEASVPALRASCMKAAGMLVPNSPSYGKTLSKFPLQQLKESADALGGKLDQSACVVSVVGMTLCGWAVVSGDVGASDMMDGVVRSALSLLAACISAERDRCYGLAAWKLLSEKRAASDAGSTLDDAMVKELLQRSNDWWSPLAAVLLRCSMRVSWGDTGRGGLTEALDVILGHVLRCTPLATAASFRQATASDPTTALLDSDAPTRCGSMGAPHLEALQEATAACQLIPGMPAVLMRRLEQLPELSLAPFAKWAYADRRCVEEAVVTAIPLLPSGVDGANLRNLARWMLPVAPVAASVAFKVAASSAKESEAADATNRTGIDAEVLARTLNGLMTLRAEGETQETDASTARIEAARYFIDVALSLLKDDAAAKPQPSSLAFCRALNITVQQVQDWRERLPSTGETVAVMESLFKVCQRRTAVLDQDRERTQLEKEADESAKWAALAAKWKEEQAHLLLEAKERRQREAKHRREQEAILRHYRNVELDAAARRQAMMEHVAARVRGLERLQQADAEEQHRKQRDRAEEEQAKRAHHRCSEAISQQYRRFFTEVGHMSPNAAYGMVYTVLKRVLALVQAARNDPFESDPQVWNDAWTTSEAAQYLAMRQWSVPGDISGVDATEYFSDDALPSEPEESAPAAAGLGFWADAIANAEKLNARVDRVIIPTEGESSLHHRLRPLLDLFDYSEWTPFPRFDVEWSDAAAATPGGPSVKVPPPIPLRDVYKGLERLEATVVLVRGAPKRRIDAGDDDSAEPTPDPSDVPTSWLQSLGWSDMRHLIFVATELKVVERISIDDTAPGEVLSGGASWSERVVPSEMQLRLTPLGAELHGRWANARRSWRAIQRAIIADNRQLALAQLRSVAEEQRDQERDDDDDDDDDASCQQTDDDIRPDEATPPRYFSDDFSRA